MSSGPELTPEDVKEILRLVDESRFDEFELETPTFTVRFRRGAAAPTAGVRPGSDPWGSNAPIGAADGVAAPTGGVRPGSDPWVSAEADGLVEVTSPMVGTFYRSPAPEAPPFVEAGARVEAQSPVCIIEVMKLMNRVAAGVAGEVVEVCRGDGESVQYGDVLFRVKPDA